LEYQPLLIAEPDKIDITTRIHIFKEIFNNYKVKQIWIPRDKINYIELAHFGQSIEIVDFLINELENATHYTTLCNAIELLGLMDVPHNRKQKVSKLLVNLSINGKNGEIVQNHALIALASLKLNSQKVVDKIVSTLYSSKSVWVRYGLYYLLHTSDYLDKYIEVFLDGIEYVRLYPSINTSETRLSNEHWHLNKGLEKAKSAEALVKIFKYFKEHPKDLDDAFFENSINILAENAAIVYQTEPLLFELVLDLFNILVNTYLEKEATLFLCFFDKTNTRLKAFRCMFEQRGDNQHYLIALAILADMNCAEYFVQQYEEGKVNDRDVWGFQNYLGLKNRDLYLSFNDFINKKSGNKFVLPPKRDFDKERKQRMQHNIDLLFDKESFLNEVKLIFNKEKKQTFTSKELLDLQVKHAAKPYFSDVVLYTLHHIAKSQPMSLEMVTQLLESWDWDLFCVTKIYEYMSNDKDLILSKEQNDLVTNWCLLNVHKIDFKTAITNNPHSRNFSANHLAILLWFFLRRLNITYPHDVLLDMLSFDWVEGNQMLGIRYLEERLSVADISFRIMDNLQKEIQNDDVLKNHIDYCRRHKLVDVLPYALREINNTSRNPDLRKIALETFCELSEDLSALEQLLPLISDDFRWTVIKHLVKKNVKSTKLFLLDTLSKGNEQDQLKAAEYLLEFQDPVCLDGLKYYVTWIRKHKQLPTESFERSPLYELQSPETVPYLIELLGLSYQDDFTHNTFHRLDNTVLEVLMTMALKSDQNYVNITTAIETFIRQYSSVMENVNFLYSFLERLEQRYYIAKTEQLDITDVLKVLDKIYA